jgi:hypothetical protein
MLTKMIIVLASVPVLAVALRRPPHRVTERAVPSVQYSNRNTACSHIDRHHMMTLTQRIIICEALHGFQVRLTMGLSLDIELKSLYVHSTLTMSRVSC